MGYFIGNNGKTVLLYVSFKTCANPAYIAEEPQIIPIIPAIFVIVKFPEMSPTASEKNNIVITSYSIHYTKLYEIKYAVEAKEEGKIFSDNVFHDNKKVIALAGGLNAYITSISNKNAEK